MQGLCVFRRVSLPLNGDGGWGWDWGPPGARAAGRRGGAACRPALITAVLRLPTHKAYLGTSHTCPAGADLVCIPHCGQCVSWRSKLHRGTRHVGRSVCRACCSRSPDRVRICTLRWAPTLPSLAHGTKSATLSLQVTANCRSGRGLGSMDTRFGGWGPRAATATRLVPPRPFSASTRFSLLWRSSRSRAGPQCVGPPSGLELLPPPSSWTRDALAEA